jgi:hypothetical protein
MQRKALVVMTIAVIAALAGLLIAVAAIGIPQLVRIRHQRPNDDTQAYLKQTGRSAPEIERGNAAVAEHQRSASGGPRPGGV